MAKQIYKYNKKENGKNATGAPSKIKDIDFEQVRKLASYGLIDREIADILGISEVTLNAWKKDESSEFLKSLKAGKEISDSKVVKSLYKRAIGYEYDEVTYEKSGTGGLGLKISKDEIQELKHVDTNKTKITTKQIAPDVTAQIFWLCNRRREEWQNVNRIEHAGPDGKPLKTNETTINIQKLSIAELKKLAGE
jgi:transcriptional regulator with XRE-family HTH domain